MPHGESASFWYNVSNNQRKEQTMIHSLLLAIAVTVQSVGEVKLNCANPGSWKFEMTAEKTADGVDAVRVRMRSAKEAPPPKFSVNWFVSQRDTHHFWTSESTHYGIPWSKPCVSDLSCGMPLYAFLDANDRNRWTFACSESCRRIEFRSPISETTMGFHCGYSFFVSPEAPLADYEVCVRFDNRDLPYWTTIGDASDWMCAAAGIEPMAAPDTAFDPLYSSWYVFHQDVTAAGIEEESELAAKLGMKTLITDDGWQIDLPPGNRAWGGYRLCGDWKAGRNFPDMAAHVRRVQEKGFKYMVWYSVPFVGEKSANFARFKGKYLPVQCAGGHVLDPRFPEVREFTVKTYEDAVRDWNIDGLKLDFIGRFTLPEGVEDPAVKENYAGRDIKAIPLAVDAMLTEVMRRLRAIKPDILIEFRQSYISPSIRRFGNMIRATDCPCSMVENRTRTTRLRLTSGRTAVHADMLEWRKDETSESAARCIINSLFSVVQYSVRLKTLPEAHRRMVAHWIRFSQEHRPALLKGAFRPHYPAADYPLLEGESAAERIFGVYQENLVVDVGTADRPVVVMNGANTDSLVLNLPTTPEKVEAFDTFGNRVTAPALKAGLNRAAVPVSGYLKLAWKAGKGVRPIRFMTFNIYGAGYGGFTAAEREDRAIATVRKAAPDLISWQEVNGGWWQSRLFTSMDEFATVRGDEDDALVRAGADLAQRKNNWVNHEPLMYRKSRFTLLDSGLDFYHVSIQFEKSLTWAVLEDKTDGRRLVAFATHYWWKANGTESDAIRELNTRHVLWRLGTIREKWGDLPVVGGGDLNCEAGHIALTTFERNGFASAGLVAPVRSTVPSEHGAIVRDAEGKCRGRIGKIGEKGHHMIDHVFFSKDRFSALKHDVVTDPDTLDISDHSPVVVDLQLK